MRSLNLIAAWALLAALLAPPALARNDNASANEIAVAALPREARQTLQSIKRGGPFGYERDGVVFGNYERACRRASAATIANTPADAGRETSRCAAHRGGRRRRVLYSDDHYGASGAYANESSRRISVCSGAVRVYAAPAATAGLHLPRAPLACLFELDLKDVRAKPELLASAREYSACPRRSATTGMLSPTA